MEVNLIRTQLELKDKAIPLVELMARQISRLEEDLEFQSFAHSVEKFLEENFFGTYCSLEVNAKPEHIMALMWLYRHADWKVDYFEKDDKPYLCFRDPMSQQALHAS